MISLRLKGFLRGDRALPFIKISIRSQIPKIKKSFDFLIDTGSDITFISRKDAITSGISFSKLGTPQKSIIGIGSGARRWPIKATLHFINEEKKIEKFPSEIYIVETGTECPSILGRDFIIKNNFKLVYDYPNKQVYLEK